ncbi:MAG TPA: cell division protein ZapA [Nitrospiraceae bacterium]|nr:cell division protein ZapA [Nitrospiraceae bacterium]
MTKTIEVEIYGQQFSISGAAEEAYVHKLAEVVDKQMKQVAQGLKTATPHKLAVLAALNIAHELQECEKKIQRLEADMERRMLSLMESIDEQMPSSTTAR